jgi:hypothetical protein
MGVQRSKGFAQRQLVGRRLEPLAFVFHSVENIFHSVDNFFHAVENFANIFP